MRQDIKARALINLVIILTREKKKRPLITAIEAQGQLAHTTSGVHAQLCIKLSLAPREPATTVARLTQDRSNSTNNSGRVLQKTATGK